MILYCNIIIGLLYYNKNERVVLMTNKKTKIIFIIAIVEFILLVVSGILIARVIKTNSELRSPLPGYFVADPTLILNDGKFYFNGDTDSIYYDVKDDNIQLVFTEENYKEYCRKSSPNRSEDRIDKAYNWTVEFWKEPRPYNVWVCYLQPPESDMLFLSFQTFNIEMDGRNVPAPGVGWDYIDENNFGSRSGEIYTRISEEENL